MTELLQFLAWFFGPMFICIIIKWIKDYDERHKDDPYDDDRDPI